LSLALRREFVFRIECAHGCVRPLGRGLELTRRSGPLLKSRVGLLERCDGIVIHV
jgi:hypothetical protein